ncbi:hypothetical protein [uncultured Nocardioides sp.]|uniref:hypothetical protein n=1 Tax=uncultured Nocardioides sp. TaxID=198441 RepID=UPI00262FF11A|nr:hypothetical protein [uncultured Nocardioides sp.]
MRGDETVADLYRRAIDVFGEEPLTTGALMIGSHCIREMVNRLPRVLGEVKVHGQRGDGGSERLLERALEAYDEDPTSAATAHLADAARALIQSRRDASERSARMRAALVVGDNDPGGSRSTLAAVRGAVAWFEKFRHPQNRDLSRWPTSSTGEVIEHLEVIEQALYGRLGRFFDVLADVSDLLVSANAKVDDEWVAPTPETVRGVLPRLADPQHRRAFYIGLHNPRWLPELDAQHAFSDPPLRRDDTDGSSTYQAWPQGDYLRKIAAEVPVEAAQVLARVFRKDVAWSVHELVVATAGEAPREAAAILANAVTSCVTSGFASRFVGVDAIRVVETLAPGSRSQRRKAKLIADSLLQPFRDPDGPSRPLLGRFTVVANVDEHDYEDAVRRVVGAFDGDLGIFNSLTRWLAAEQRLSGTFDPDGYDASHIRRPSIANPRHHMQFDTVSDTLIDAVRDCAANLAPRVGLPSVLHTLRAQYAPIFVRIELHCLAHEIQHARKQGQRPSADVMLEAARRLTAPELAESGNCQRELDELAAAALPLLDDVNYARWESTVLGEPDFDEATRLRIASFSPPNLTPDDAVADFVERQRLHRLAAVGREALRGHALRMLDELVAKHGAVPTTDSSGEWREDREDDFGFHDMAPRQVVSEVARLIDDTLADSGGDVPRRHDRLGRALGQAVTRNPTAFSTLAHEVLRLDALAVGYYLSGLADALREADAGEVPDDHQPDPEVDEQVAEENDEEADRELSGARGPDVGGAGEAARSGTNTFRSLVDWTSVLDALLALVAAHSSLNRGGQPQSVVEARQMRSNRKDLCRLLTAGAAKDIPAEQIGPAIALAAAMASDPDPTTSPDEAVHPHAVHDPLSYSVETVRSTATNAVFVLVAAHVRRRYGPAGSTPEADLARDPIVCDALAALERRLAPHRDPSIAVAVVFGEHAGWLLRHLPAWFAQRNSMLATPDAFGEAFIAAALTSHYPNLGVLETVQPGWSALLGLRGSAEPPQDRRQDRSLAQLFGDRVLKVYLWGHIELHDPMLVEYHHRAPIAERAAVLSELGWEMVRADSIEPAIMERAMALWDSRRGAAEDGDGDLAELAGFESWVRCGFFPHSWWLPRLIVLARAVDIEGLHFVGDQLAAAAATAEHLPEALEALDLLVRQCNARTGGITYQLRKAAHQILEQALRSPDPLMRRKGDDLLNFMGRNSGIFIDPELTRLAEAALP